MSKHREAMAESIVNWRRGSSNSGHLFSAVLPPRSSPPLFNVALDLASAQHMSQYNVCSLSKPCFRFLYRGQSRLISGHQKKRRIKIKRVAALRVTVFHSHEHYIYFFFLRSELLKSWVTQRAWSLGHRGLSESLITVPRLLRVIKSKRCSEINICNKHIHTPVF